MTETQALVVSEPRTCQVVNLEEYAMTPDRIIKQVELIREVMRKVMKEGDDYGTIPGTPKPSLWKPGAEKLGVVFRFQPEYEIIREVRQPDHIAYTVRCVLIHMPTGTKVAEGLGSCSTKEDKYRWKNEEELTEDPVPQTYWKAKSAGDNKEMQRILGPGNKARKNEETGMWVIAKRSGRVENDNPWNYDNTILKMACKRAHVASTLNGTAASDIFSQELEDMAENGTTVEHAKQENKQSQSRAKNTRQASAPPVEEPPIDIGEQSPEVSPEVKRQAMDDFMADLVAIESKAAVIEWFNRNSPEIKKMGLTKEISAEVQNRLKELK
jgi:hypothetical protein